MAEKVLAASRSRFVVDLLGLSLKRRAAVEVPCRSCAVDSRNVEAEDPTIPTYILLLLSLSLEMLVDTRKLLSPRSNRSEFFVYLTA
jgi:hypothetical protein